MSTNFYVTDGTETQAHIAKRTTPKQWSFQAYASQETRLEGVETLDQYEGILPQDREIKSIADWVDVLHSLPEGVEIVDEYGQTLPGEELTQQWEGDLDHRHDYVEWNGQSLLSFRDDTGARFSYLLFS